MLALFALYILLHGALVAVLRPLAYIVPGAWFTEVSQWRAQAMSTAAAHCITQSHLLVSGDCLIKERAVIIVNHQSFWDYFVCLALAAQVRATAQFSVQGRLVAFPTIRSLLSYWTQNKKPLVARECQDWIIVFPERARYSRKLAAQAPCAAPNLLEPSFREVAEVLSQTPIEAVYDLTIFYGSLYGTQADPHLDDATYCSVTVRRLDAHRFKRRSPEQQLHILQRLWRAKSNHLSKLKRA